MTYLFTAIWPVHDTQLKLPGLILAAEEDLMTMLDEQQVTLTAEPQWTLLGDRLSCTAPARRRAPWDVVDPEDAAKAYFLDLMPDGAAA